MNQGKPKMWSKIVIWGCCIFLMGIGQSALAFNAANWDILLNKYVAPKTIEGIPLKAVNYRALQKDPLYKQVIADLEKVQLSNFKTKEEQLAFWINAYNIMAIKMVLDHYPVQGIKDAGGLFTTVWKLNVGTVAGKERTLNEIEHDILRKMGEPRIHVAIVCASLSCPDIRPEAYISERLNEQLDDQMQSFLSNEKKGLQVDVPNDRLYLSSIFKWFAEDFESKGGVRPYLAGYAPEKVSALLKNDKFRVTYLDYNWNLNQFKIE